MMGVRMAVVHEFESGKHGMVMGSGSICVRAKEASSHEVLWV